MATTKVSALAAKTSLAGSEELLINDSGTSKKVTATNLLAGVSVADGSISTAKIADDAVTEAKLANAINTAIAANTAKTSNATHTGDVTGATELTIASGAVETGMIADDAVTADKLANSINTEIAANTAKVTNATHTGDVTGATALTIADDAVTADKLANSINTDIATGVTANTTANAALPKAGGTMTGNIVMGDDTSIGIADDAERIEFDGAGDINVLGAKLGIGTTTPNRMLTVEGDGNEPDISLVQLDNTNNNFNEIRFLSVGSDDSTRRVGASVKGIYTTHNATNPTTDLSFETRNAGGTLAERLRIDSEGTITVATNAVGTMTTDNDGSFSMSASNNFKCTPTGNFTLTFTNIVAQSGNIILVNSGGHTVSAHANTKVDANLLATVSTAGTYLLSYFSDGTNVYMTNSAIYT